MILLVDFGSSFILTIEDRLKDLNVNYQKVDHTFNSDVTKYSGIILSGSPDSVFDNGRVIDKEYLLKGIPTLGICYGHQLVHYLFNGEVTVSSTPERNIAPILKIDVDNEIFKDLDKEFNVPMYHSDEWVKLADGFINLGSTKRCKYAATYNKDLNIYTFQFHPEVIERCKESLKLFSNFLDICHESHL